MSAHVPGRREAWLSVAALFGLALAVRIVAAACAELPRPRKTRPTTPASPATWSRGAAWSRDALWSYQTQPLAVPRDAFEVVAAAAQPAGRDPRSLWRATANWFRAAQVVSVVASAVVVALAWRLGADVAAELRLPVGRARTLAAGTGLVCCFLGPLVVYGMLPDSTALFAALALARLPADDAPGGPARPDAGSTAGCSAWACCIGLAALTRSEAVWLGLAWALTAWLWTRSAWPALPRSPGLATRPPRRLVLIAVPAAVAAAVFAPWAVRDWLAFGTPLPGQTLSNALSIDPTDIFAYRDQPTLARYLAEGPAALLGMRVSGILHNLFAVLVLPGFPIGLIGLLALPKSWRLASLRPLLLTAAITFAVTSLVFPVSTTWGTFLHAAGAIYVLLVVSCLVALDAFIAFVHRIRHWWRPVAWLGPALATAVACPLLLVSLNALDAEAADVRDRYSVLPAALERAGAPLDGAAPVITDNPIWLAETAQRDGHRPARGIAGGGPGTGGALRRHAAGRRRRRREDLAERPGPGRPAPRSASARSNLRPDRPIRRARLLALAKIHAFRIGCP